MFTFFKKLLVGQPTEAKAAGSSLKVRMGAQPSAARQTRPATQPTFKPAPRAPQRNDSEVEAGDASGQGDTQPGNQGVQLLLQSVVNGLPLELKGRARQVSLGNAVISIPLDKILAQLSLGSVKIPFGDLRRAAPTLFSDQNDQDQTLVPLPLAEILPQLNPALLFRRQSQKQIEIPEEVRSPFGNTGNGLIFSVGPGETPASTPARTNTPTSSATPAAPIRPAAVPHRPLAAAYPPAPVTAPTPAVPPPVVPFQNAPVTVPAPTVPAAVEAPALISMPVPKAEIVPAPAVPPAAVVPEGATVSIPLSLVSESWPESLRLEIVQWKHAGISISMPLDTLRESLQRGKAFYTWKTLRAWLNPPLAPAVSVHDNASLELPLSIVAPLFISRQRDLAQSKQKVAIDENIPNLFFGFPQPEAAAPAGSPPAPAGCAVTKPVDTNYYSVSDDQEAGAVVEAEVKRTGPTGTAFVTKCATPNEIVSRAASLTGVSGALVALPDGLMVASKLSADLNGDTLAAFLPQIFGKVNQCTKELRMGELNNLNFTVGNVPWKIFRVNAIFFAAFGRAGQPLPTAELAALAGELDHKKQ